MSGLAVVTASGMAVELDRLGKSAQATDAAVQRCPGLDDATRAAWGIFYTQTMAMAALKPQTLWASSSDEVVASAGFADQIILQESELRNWQNKIDAAGCAGVMAITPYDNRLDPTGALKWIGIAAATLGGAYVVGQVVGVVGKMLPQRSTPAPKSAAPETPAPRGRTPRRQYRRLNRPIFDFGR
jgi:hypothetical protein